MSGGSGRYGAGVAAGPGSHQPELELRRSGGGGGHAGDLRIRGAADHADGHTLL